jgi:cell division septum initiation protein DivIVA
VGNDLPVVLAKKGLDPEQVNVALGDVQVEVSRLESDRAEIDKRIDTLTREIAEVRSALKRSSAKPSFSDLGAAFEQTLRVAEEQAGKLIADAQTASTSTRRLAETDSAALSETAEKQSAKMVQDAQSRVDRLLAESQKKLEDTLKIAQAGLAHAEAVHLEAQQVAASTSSEGEQKRQNLETDLAREIDQSRGQIATLRQLHERDHRRISDEVDASRAKAERESTRLASENETYIRHLLEDSQQQLDEARVRAREMVVEAQRNFGQARQDGVALVREARETAAGIVRRARARAQTLTERLEERNAILLANGEQLVEDLSFEREAVEAFNSELRIISMSERASEDSDIPYDFDSATSLESAEEDLVESLGMNEETIVPKKSEG